MPSASSTPFPERVVVAAGAPWFMTVFGWDSLLTAWMALLVDPDLARGVLQTLARFQGKDVDPRHDEEPDAFSTRCALEMRPRSRSEAEASTTGRPRHTPLRHVARGPKIAAFRDAGIGVAATPSEMADTLLKMM